MSSAPASVSRETTSASIPSSTSAAVGSCSHQIIIIITPGLRVQCFYYFSIIINIIVIVIDIVVVSVIVIVIVIVIIITI